MYLLNFIPWNHTNELYIVLKWKFIIRFQHFIVKHKICSHQVPLVILLRLILPIQENKLLVNTFPISIHEFLNLRVRILGISTNRKSEYIQPTHHSSKQICYQGPNCWSKSHWVMLSNQIFNLWYYLQYLLSPCPILCTI